MAGPLSGRYGVVNDVPDITQWSVSEESTPVESATSATKGGTRVSNGVLSSTGSYAGKSGIPKLKPFVKASFEGYTAPDDEVYGSDGVVVTGDIYAQTITINMNWGGNEDVNYNIDFQFDQDMVIGSGFYADNGPPLAASICPCKIEYGDEGSETEIEHITSATLTFTMNLLEYINSSTNCTTGRKPGTFNWTLDIEIEDNVRPVAIQSDERLKVWVNATQYFVLEFGHLASYTNLVTDPSTGEIISQTMNWVMQAYKQSDLATIGAIYWPDDPANPIWPPVAATVAATVESINDSPI